MCGIFIDKWFRVVSGFFLGGGNLKTLKMRLCVLKVTSVVANLITAVFIQLQGHA